MINLLKVVLAIMLIAGIAASTAPILYADETSDLILKLLIKKELFHKRMWTR